MQRVSYGLTAYIRLSCRHYKHRTLHTLLGRPVQTAIPTHGNWYHPSPCGTWSYRTFASKQHSASGGGGGSVSYVCSQCGSQHTKWMGKCDDCGSWGTVEERTVSPFRAVAQTRNTSARTSGPPVGWTEGIGQSDAMKLSEVAASEVAERISLRSGELDRVFGGGIVPGSLTLIGGDPGIGKSTLVLQLAHMLCSVGPHMGPVLYISGEETAAQLKMRARRLNIDSDAHAGRLYLWNEANLDRVLDRLGDLKPSAVIVDSIQTIYTSASNSAPGSVSQVKECAAQLLRMAKAGNVATFITGHVTKTGDLAGPRMLEHLVDTVLYLEGEPYQSQRLLRVIKNRFGSSNDLAVFDMQKAGMVEVLNPSLAFLHSREDTSAESASTSGSAIAAVVQGSRPLMVEIQALTNRTTSMITRHRCNGLSTDRFHMLLAVLQKHLRLPLGSHDVFASVVGGLTLEEPAADLAIAAALTSSFTQVHISTHTAFAGEIGLNGEIRPVLSLDRRITEAAKLGFKELIVPAANHIREHSVPSGSNLHVRPVRTLASALAFLRTHAPRRPTTDAHSNPPDIEENETS